MADQPITDEADVQRYARVIAENRGSRAYEEHGTYAATEREQLESDIRAVLAALGEDGKQAPC